MEQIGSPEKPKEKSIEAVSDEAKSQDKEDNLTTDKIGDESGEQRQEAFADFGDNTPV